MDIWFHIPDFANHFKLNLIIINFIKERPEYFYDGVKIASVYGTCGGMVWNGGRYLGGGMDVRTIKAVLETFNSRNVPIRFTLTNPLIEEKHLQDLYCNQVLRVADNSINEVIVMSPVIEKHIRDNYPNYPITSSTCKQIEDIDGLNEELKKDYKYVVLDYNLNNRFDLLEKIAPDDRARCEILVNACCTPGCKRRGEHYRQIGQEQINEWEHKNNYFNKKPYEAQVYSCPTTNNTIYDIVDFTTYISPKDILEKYLPMGFNQFKIEGRTASDINLLETYIHYMAKPEYKDKLRLKILNMLTSKYRYFNN